MIKRHPLLLISLSALTMLVACSAKNKVENQSVPKTVSNMAYRTAALQAPVLRNPSVNLPNAAPGGGKITYSRVRTNLPYIAMTFDDGPHPKNTPRLLDMLRKRNIKATFYVIGRNVRMYPNIVRRIVAEGHEIGSHTYTHRKLTSLSDAAVRSELSKTRDAIVAACGVKPRTMRPPYGALRRNQRAWINKEFGYPTILWDVDPEDWKRPGVSVVTSRILKGAKNGSIILSHDLHKPTVDAMPATLDGLLRKGFKFVTVSQLISLEGTPPSVTTQHAPVPPVKVTPPSSPVTSNVNPVLNSPVRVVTVTPAQ